MRIFLIWDYLNQKVSIIFNYNYFRKLQNSKNGIIIRR